MFTIDADHAIKYETAATATGWAHQFFRPSGLAGIIATQPGSYAVKLWNQLPVTPIHTAKFRNRATAVERIWNKLAELYPDAILPEDMPNKKQRGGYARKASKMAKAPNLKAGAANHRKATARKPSAKSTAGRNGNGTRKSAWAQELTDALRKRFNPGQEFTLEDVYKLIPAFQRRHKGNRNVAARLRATLAQDLRGKGIVRQVGKKRGRYALAA